MKQNPDDSIAGGGEETISITGLTTGQILVLQKQFGRNELSPRHSNRLFHKLRNLVRDPMLILLIFACSLYFMLGNNDEGAMMAVAILFIIAISIYQEVRSSKALEALKQFSEPRITVMRDAKEQVIRKEELVPGDVMILEEGMRIPADAIILKANDCTINESIITGESMPVDKSTSEDQHGLFQGTTVNSGKCIARVTNTGERTVLAAIGKSVEEHIESKTLLQDQISKFVKNLALFGLIAFLIILLVNYLNYKEFTRSLLFALTLAMAVVPEEIPVAFSYFMALGAHKLSRSGIICRQPQIIENLGAMSVLCLDKTGTITENKMEVIEVYDHRSASFVDPQTSLAKDVIHFAALASETNPFDTMEKAIWEGYRGLFGEHIRIPQMIHEYPLEGRPPMMSHAYMEKESIIVASKGGPERILAVSKLDEVGVKRIQGYVRELAAKGFRVIAVASAIHNDRNWPIRQDDFNWRFEGLLALYDPPKANVRKVLNEIYDAKVDVKMLTGDHPETAVYIAGDAGIINHLHYLTGEDVLRMDQKELGEAVKTTKVFARMFPDAKLKVINAIRENGEVVAMTGDGVNDGPALKNADVGIAMGKRGTEIARQASDLVLTDDNLDKVVLAIKEGRRIYVNLVKAIRYIIAIHIPIILTAMLPVLLGWKYPNIFTPVHVIFLELIMGPTCSIFFEKEPVEARTIANGPRKRQSGLFTFDELFISIMQGLLISAGVLVLYYVFMNGGHSLEKTRSMVFITLIIANVFLTFAARSFTRTLYHTLRYKNNLAFAIILVPAIFLVILQFVPSVYGLFQLVPITFSEFSICLGTAFVSVIWFELYKLDLKKTSIK